MGFERTSDFHGVDTLPFLYSGTLAAGKGAVFGDAADTDPASIWAIDVEPGATDTSATGCCFERLTIRNTGSTNALTYAFTQLDAQCGSPRSGEIASGASRVLEGGPYALIAIYSASGTDFEIEGQVGRKPNYSDSSVPTPAGHPGHGGAVSPLTCDADWLTFDSTYVSCDQTRY